MPMDVVATVVSGSGSAVMPMDVVAAVWCGNGSGSGSCGHCCTYRSSGVVMVVVVVVVVAVGTYGCSGAVVVMVVVVLVLVVVILAVVAVTVAVVVILAMVAVTVAVVVILAVVAVTVEMLDYDWCVVVNKMQGDAGVAWTSQLKLKALNDDGEVGIEALEHHISTMGSGDAWDDEVGVDGMDTRDLPMLSQTALHWGKPEHD
ncbi:hypothetical protein BU17DRAFT_66774 [Hysterangium stoloniferum]|nr:hypothetical protein BU17DRAFT_66774 [Hysterangium stoloniferum]